MHHFKDKLCVMKFIQLLALMNPSEKPEGAVIFSQGYFLFFSNESKLICWQIIKLFGVQFNS